jgi:hypothetical protein
MDQTLKEWQHSAVKLANTGAVSWRDIADLLKVPKSTVSDFLRKYFEFLNGADVAVVPNPASTAVGDIVIENRNNERVLFISDMHVPYHHPDLLPFLELMKERYAPTRVICLGDELDKHAMSFHDSDPDLPSAGDELSRALPVIKEVENLFPNMDLIDSNHGSMVYRKAKHHGIPRRYIKSYNDVLGVGDGWQWHMDLVLDMSQWNVPDVFVHHGKSKQAVKTSQAMSMSHVCGHFHESFGIEYWGEPEGSVFWHERWLSYR